MTFLQSKSSKYYYKKAYAASIYTNAPSSYSSVERNVKEFIDSSDGCKSSSLVSHAQMFQSASFVLGVAGFCS
jgi:hypothetical protein